MRDELEKFQDDYPNQFRVAYTIEGPAPSEFIYFFRNRSSRVSFELVAIELQFQLNSCNQSPVLLFVLVFCRLINHGLRLH